jgi:predicted kinase
MRSPALVLIGGGPGAGKSALARALCGAVTGAIWLDKDVLGGPLVEGWLRMVQPEADRDSLYYWSHVRPREYEALLNTALVQVSLGNIAVADAPFGPELRDATWLTAMDARTRAAGGRLVAIWRDVDPVEARRRMEARGEPRDIWKLQHWNQVCSGDLYRKPSPPVIVVSGDDAEALATVLAQLDS